MPTHKPTTTNNSFWKNGGSFEFRNEDEVTKFQVWLKQLEIEQQEREKKLLQQERERIVEKTNDLGFISNNQKEQLSKELELLDEAQEKEGV